MTERETVFTVSLFRCGAAAAPRAALAAGCGVGAPILSPRPAGRPGRSAAALRFLAGKPFPRTSDAAWFCPIGQDRTSPDVNALCPQRSK